MLNADAMPRPAIQQRRRRTPALIAIMILTITAGWASWRWWHRGQESTEDAQVEGRIVNISSRVPGQVAKVYVTDNQIVATGDVLFELDPAEYKAKLEAAKADLAAARAAAETAKAALEVTMRTAPAGLVQARGGLTTAVSSARSARAAGERASAEVAAASARQRLAQLTVERTRKLADRNAVPRSELDLRETEAEAAAAAVTEARAHLSAAVATMTGSRGVVATANGRVDAARTIAQQITGAQAAVKAAEARVAQSEAALHLAEIALEHTTVRAPQPGAVSRRIVEVGQMAAPDRPLLAIVPEDDVWVVANFKEDQVADMRAGEAAELRFDMFGRRDFTGHVESIAGATGARFALIPPDNATGNFVKVVQRIPVLIRVDRPRDVQLRPGTSAEVVVHTDPR